MVVEPGEIRSDRHRWRARTDDVGDTSYRNWSVHMFIPSIIGEMHREWHAIEGIT